MSALQLFLTTACGFAAVVCIAKAIHEEDQTGYSWHKPSRVRPFWWAIIACVLMGTCNAAKGQPAANWRILVERDTMAIGPLQDVRKWAGLRMAKNDMARQCAWELIQRNKELAGLYAERDACMDKVTKARKVMDEMRDTQEALNDRANRWQRKAKRRNPVLWMGIGAGAMLLIQQQLK